MSDRKLVYKVLVDGIEPMDADTLEAVRICGWRVVCKKGDFKVGDTALYFEVDSALNPYDTRFEFLKERCYKQFNFHGVKFDECLRIRTIKLRGVLSQGLLMKPELFCEVRNKKIGEDCGDVLMVRHYDEVTERAMAERGSVKPADQKGNFPSFVPKTDEERVQNLDDEYVTKIKDIEFEITEKRDGTSCTVFYAPSMRPDDPVGVCSRNFELKDMPSTYWDVVHKFKLDEKLKEWCSLGHPDIAIQGEITGPGIQSNRDKEEDTTFNVFRIWDIQNQRWFTWDERHDFCLAMDIYHVPVLKFETVGAFGGEPFDPVAARDNILKYAEGKTERGNEREGVVFKSKDGTVSFKAVSNRYLLGLK